MGLLDADLRAMNGAGYTHNIGELAVPVFPGMKTIPLSILEEDAAHLVGQGALLRTLQLGCVLSIATRRGRGQRITLVPGTLLGLLCCSAHNGNPCVGHGCNTSVEPRHFFRSGAGEK